MGYNDWLELKIQNNSSKTLRIKNLYVHWGKLYASPDKGTAVGEDTFNNHDIASRDALSFASCGRENSWSGTEGEFDIFDGNDRVCQVYWDCPYTGDNKLNARYVKDKWFPMVPAICTSGSIGSQTITIFTTCEFTHDFQG